MRISTTFFCLSLLGLGPWLHAQGIQASRKDPWPAEKQHANFELAEGFVIELVASEKNGLINPIDLTFDDAGRLWTQTARMYPLDPVPGINFGKAMEMMRDASLVKSDPRFQKIHRLYTLQDRGDDEILIIDDPQKQVEGQIRVWADGLAIPQSVMPYKDGCFVAHGSELFFLNDSNKDGKQDEMKPVLSGFGFFDTHTMAHSMVRAPGGWMNFSHGAINSGDVVAVKSGQKVNITYSKNARFSLDGTKLEIVNCHRDNNWGYQILANGQWYATSANDGGYSVLPAEPLSSIKGLGDENIRPYAPFFPPIHKFRVGASGISGLAFSEDGAQGFPAAWENVAILANPITQSLNSVRIVRNPDGSVTAEHLPDLLKCKDEWFRPVNIEFGPDGCLYIADWYNKIVSHNEVSTDHPDRDREHGRIWRIRHESQKPLAVPNVAEAKSEDLLSHLTKGNTIWEKRAAWHQIVDRQARELLPQLKEIILKQSAPKDVRILALWSFEELGDFDKSVLQKAMADPDSDLRREAIRALASFPARADDAAALLAPYVEDPNCMVRSPVPRTLYDITVANSATFALLVTAAKPAAPNDSLGGNYERNFERFLSRMALERYPDELVAFLLTPAVSDFPAENIVWALQALPEETRTEFFVKNWKNASTGEIDSNTFISVSRMLDIPEIREAVAPMFAERPEEMLKLTLANLEKVDAPKVARFYTEKIEALLQSGNPEELKDGLNLIIQLRSPHHTKTLTMLLGNAPKGTSRLIFTAIGNDPAVGFDVYRSLLYDEKASMSLRISALAACALRNEKLAMQDIAKLIPLLDEGSKTELVTALSYTIPGNNLLKGMWEMSYLPTEAWSYDAAHRTLAADKNDWRGTRIFAIAEQAEQAAEARRKEQIERFTKAAATLEGNPSLGEALFQSCLACHKVGEKGYEVAPPLDGSANRDTAHLITAIVNPDEAVEGAYGLYSVVRKDGSVVEGRLVKTTPHGTTIGQAGGIEIFTPSSHIHQQSAVHKRSFMPAGFGDLPDQSMIDLISYIKTLN